MVQISGDRIRSRRWEFLGFPVPEPSKEVGDVFKCFGDVFCIEFAYENWKNHIKQIEKIQTGWEF